MRRWVGGVRGETWRDSDALKFGDLGYKRCCTLLGCSAMVIHTLWGCCWCVISVDVW